MSKRRDKIIDLFEEASKRGKPISRNQRRAQSQSIKGDNNIQFQAGGDIINVVTPKTPDIKVLPPAESIGANPLLKQAIITRFNKIGDEREKRFGKNAFVVMYKKFKKDFCIKNNKWTIIWTWPKGCAPAIIDYLDKKFSNTIQGRVEKAAKREGYLHSRKHLYKMEKELLEHLDLKMDSPEVKKQMYDYFSVSSHTKLTHIQHWQWVCYLEDQVKRMEKN